MLFKYCSAGVVPKMFSSESYVSLKCSYPREFNDPYELFLTIDFRTEPGVLAFYQEVIGDLPQLPTTCFSRSPAIVPMWAHYANNASGFVIEIDEEKLSKQFPDAGFGDVDYRDDTSESLEEMLFRAYEIGKARYIHFLHQGVFSAAYYTKSTHWKYELERRMIAEDEVVKTVSGNKILNISTSCIRSIVCGFNAANETVDELRKTAATMGCDFYQVQIGRSIAEPYFIDEAKNCRVFDGTALVNSKSCKECNEPIDSKEDRCGWCRIDDAHRSDAAARNVYRAMDRAGILDDYLKDVANIDRSES